MGRYPYDSTYPVAVIYYPTNYQTETFIDITEAVHKSNVLSRQGIRHTTLVHPCYFDEFKELTVLRSYEEQINDSE